MAAAVNSAWKIIPALESRSIEATVDFYVRELGFSLGGTMPDDESGEELTFCSIFAGAKAAANFYFFKNTGETFKTGSFLVALGTEELDEFFYFIKEKKTIRIAEHIADQPWGYRQFSILDPDDNKITFFKFLEGGNPGAN